MHNIKINVVFNQALRCSVYISKNKGGTQELQGKVWDRTRAVIKKGEGQFQVESKEASSVICFEDDANMAKFLSNFLLEGAERN